MIAVPSIVSFIWFSILGGAALDLQLNEGWRPAVDAAGNILQEQTLFDMLREFPRGSRSPWPLILILIAIFFVTGADSASIVMGTLSQQGKEEPSRWTVVFWGVATGAVAAVLPVAGGLEGLQTLVILVAVPFILVLIGMCVSLMKALREETFESTLPSRVRRAVEYAEKHRDE